MPEKKFPPILKARRKQKTPDTLVLMGQKTEGAFFTSF